MNILMTSHYALPHRGGIETIIDKLSSSMVAEGHHVRVISSRMPAMSAMNLPGRDIYSIPAWDPLKRFGVHYPLFSPSLISVVCEAVRWAEVVHVQGMLYQNSALALWLARKYERPTILTEHAGYVPYNRPVLNSIQKIAVATLGGLSLALSDAIIVPDTIVKDILIRSIHVSPEKISQIPLGVDADFFHPVPPEAKMTLRAAFGWSSRPKVLFVGNFVARKRLSLLFDAMSDRFDVILCGEGDPPSPLPPRVTIYPAMEHDRLVKLYQAADIFVVPSSVETFSIVAFEAMACGLPVVMTNDLRHLTIAQSKLVDFVGANPAELQQAILSLVDDPTRRERVGTAGADWVRDNFSWRRTLELHMELYKRLLQAVH